MTRRDPAFVERLRTARRLAREAGRLVASYARETDGPDPAAAGSPGGHPGSGEKTRRRGIARKSPLELVTEADHRAEALLLDGLREAHPEDAFVGEESGWSSPGGEGAAPGRERPRWTWVVDPLDGTTNFVHGLEHYAVSIGLLDRGEPVAGAIDAPARGVTYHAHLGGGAWCDEEPLAVGSAERLADSLLVTGFPYDRDQRAAALLGPVQRALERSRGLRRLGSAAMDFVDVARGVFDGYWERGLRPWDAAAGIVLVREAGGRVSGYDGGPVLLGLDETDAEAGSELTVVASNGRVHDELLELVADGR